MNRTNLLILILGLINFAQGQANGFCNLVWSDEFNGNTLSSDWTKEATCYGGGNNEMQCYTQRDKNIFLNNGNLVLKAYREGYAGTREGCTDTQGCTNWKPYTSGRVNTARSKSWTYGRFETRAKLPSGIQLWPAIWMLPTEYRYGGWAASGEIDIMEARGNNPWEASGTLHHGGQWPQNVWTTTGDKSIGADLSADFHVYTVEWTADSLKWYIDNTLTQTYNLNRWWNSSAQNVYSKMGQPWDQKFHFILNLAVGGNFFGNVPQVTDAQSAAWALPEMRVDYVRVYQQGGNCNGAPAPSQAPDNNPRPSSQAADNTARPGVCNGQGYDSNSYTCTVNEQGRQVLCYGSNVASCGNACYNPTQYCCPSGNLIQKSQCPAISVPTVYKTTSATAAATTAVATPPTTPVSNQCNGQGFDVAVYSCTDNDLGQKVLCPKNQQSCGNACYVPSSYCCKSGSKLTQKSQC